MSKFTEISPVGVQCGNCGCIMPKVDMRKHFCSPESIFRHAKEVYELEDINKRKKEVSMTHKFAIGEAVTCDFIGKVKSVGLDYKGNLCYTIENTDTLAVQVHESNLTRLPKPEDFKRTEADADNEYERQKEEGEK